ncbi:Phosphate ABC transporter, periplasmic phosphate-binding protein PstS [Labilithrix luteola]|uniref:Phosphate-binding protein n=1 Tax=Labilithrix luteola TaxID=1391654 RepID=A0A0K1PSL8_9BACT|nr:phosphate ABC transporter substrate-binding protein PstS [Labilithrix luteola]AKU96361.1 Phosphate ABC transporter, periplasmic phosphate-binding protein PstS [Labilithrix luteola]
MTRAFCTHRSILTAGALLVLPLVVACSRSGSVPSETSPQVLVGAGATLPSPLYSKWASSYATVEPTVRVNYQSVGSGAGIRQTTDGVVDFGATEEPVPGTLVHVPMTVGAVAFAYNATIDGELALTPNLAANILLGRIKRWDDEAIRAENPGRSLPSEPITIVHRADGSGTSAALTTWLSARSDAWRTEVGAGTAPRFPVGVGAKGNEGVAALVKSTPNSLGYVELAYAKHAGLRTALVANRAGKRVAPSVEGIARALASSPALGDDLHAKYFEATDESAYPIVAVSFVVLRENTHDQARSAALAKFLWWAIHDGQQFAQPLDYAALPSSLVTRGEVALHALKVDGKPVLPAGG